MNSLEHHDIGIEAEMDIRSQVADCSPEVLAHFASDSGFVGAEAREALRQMGWSVTTSKADGVRTTTVKEPST